tara:strand:+ start:6734 stop:7720 length:987 start_codon:yes stop_codon:yes gene_type:complete
MSDDKSCVNVENISDVASDMLSGINRRTKDHYGRGIWNDVSVQASPKFNAAPSEKVISNGNAWIVVGGQDRLGPLEGPGGLGARGHTHTDKIDLVVGRQSADPDYNTATNPSPFSDAARIYISQRTYCDKTFAIDHNDANAVHEGNENRSAVVAKADGVRIIGRESIKIVTGKGKDVKGGRHGERNSQGGKITHIGKIDLIAGNNLDDDEFNRVKTLQPMVRGNNLVDAIQDLTEIIESIQSATLNFIRKQNRINMCLASHTHIASGPGMPTGPSVRLATNVTVNSPTILISKATLQFVKYGLLNYRLKFIQNPAAPRYICSRGCRLT